MKKIYISEGGTIYPIWDLSKLSLQRKRNIQAIIKCLEENTWAILKSTDGKVVLNTRRSPERESLILVIATRKRKVTRRFAIDLMA